MSEKRAYPRLPIKVKVDFTCNDAVQTVSSLNISAGGIYLLTRNPLPLGSMVVLKINLPNLESAVEVLGEVAWNNVHSEGESEFPEGMGIRFLNQSSLISEHLGTFQGGRMGNS